MSKFVCIYHVKEQILRKKFEISCNLSLDAMEVRSGGGSRAQLWLPRTRRGAGRGCGVRACGHDEEAVLPFSSFSPHFPPVLVPLTEALGGRLWAGLSLSVTHTSRGGDTCFPPSPTPLTELPGLSLL